MHLSETLRGYVPLEPTELHPEWESKQGGGAPMTAREMMHLDGRAADEGGREE